MDDDRFATELLARFSEMVDGSTKRVELRIDGFRAEFLDFRRSTEANFDVLAGHVGRFESRFDVLETRFNQVESRFDGLEYRFDRLENRVGALETRLMTFETKVYLRFDAIDARFDALEPR